MERRAFAVTSFQSTRWTARFAGYRNDVPWRRSRIRCRSGYGAGDEGDPAVRGGALAPPVEWACRLTKRCSDVYW